jgi:predicted extracellular nuclease
MRSLLTALAATLVMAAPASAASQELVISQVYGGGGNTGASHTNDFIEIFNRGAEAVPLDGMSLQYASATGTGNFGANSGQLTELSGSVGAGRYFLVQEAGGTVGAALPAPDQTDATAINMSGTAGKVALVTGTATLGCNGGSQPCDPTQRARIVDLVGYGNANFFEGAAPAPGLSNSTSAQRKTGGCVDTDDNAADFDAAATAPRNSGSPRRFCDADLAPAVSAQTPAAGAADVAQDADVTITFSEDVTTTGDWFSISCSQSGAHTAATTGGPRTYTLDPDTDFAENESCTVTVRAANVTDTDENDPPDNMEADKTWSFSTVAPTYRIHEIQGSTHLSPHAGERTSFVPGVVTAVTTNGFWMQDPQPDADPATSEAIFVFTSSKPAVTKGTAVTVSGEVSEFRPGGASTINLTTTELQNVTVYPGAAGADIAATVIGAGGRVPPSRVIEDDANGSVETSGVFDPQQDGIDFYESLEGMKVQVNDAVVVGPQSNTFGELWVVGDNGANAGLRTSRGGVVVAPDDFNPERIQLDDVLAATPKVDVGDTIPGATVGVLSYDFGNFELLPLKPPGAVSGGLARETTQAPSKNELEIASFNVENLAPGDPDSKYTGLATTLIKNLQAPDLVAVEEIQDNTGATDNGVTDASVTWNKLIAAIQKAGGPTYQYEQIDPVNDQDGGQPGGNIRQGFLFRTDRGLAFVDRPGGTSTNSTEVVRTRRGPQLTFSPGRIQPNDPAFTSSRKPLAGEFTWKGKRLIVVANHFNSKGGDDPLFGHHQPPVRVTEEQRHRQATIVNAFARDIQRADPLSNYVVLGDLNDFEFSETVQILQGFQMLDLYYLLPPSERYSYVFEGNSQALDHILVSPALLAPLPAYDSVHVNSEFADQQSDHDPQVVRLRPN